MELSEFAYYAGIVIGYGVLFTVFGRYFDYSQEVESD